jgi:hypothetical protein
LRKLVKDHEASLCVHFARPFRPSFTPLCASRATPTPPLLQPRTFRWLAECRLRSSLLRDLKEDGFCWNMHYLYHHTSFCGTCISKLVGDKGSIGIDVLLKVVDANEGGLTRRVAQRACIAALSPAELAQLQLLLYGFSVTYAKMILAQADYDDTIRETECVIREMLLRNGPYFIWAGLHGTTAEQNLVQNSLDAGLKELRDYETSTYPSEVNNSMAQSLQSFVIEVFCRRTKCEKNGSLDKMRDLAVADFLSTCQSLAH